MISTLCFHVVVLIIIVIFAISTIALAGQSSLDSSLVNSAGPDKSGNLWFFKFVLKTASEAHFDDQEKHTNESKHYVAPREQPTDNAGYWAVLDS